MGQQIRFGIGDAAPLSSYSVVEGNRFVDRGSIYVMGSTLIAHPDVLDKLRGYGKVRRWMRRAARWLSWRLVGRANFQRDVRRGRYSINRTTADGRTPQDLG